MFPRASRFFHPSDPSALLFFGRTVFASPADMSKKTQRDTRLTIRLAESLRQALEDEARLAQVSVNAMTRKILIDHVARRVIANTRREAA
jgi:hypothetical protein